MTPTLRPNNSPDGQYANPGRCDGCGRQIPEFVFREEQVYDVRVDEYRAADGQTTAWTFCPECGAEAVSFLTDEIAFPDLVDQPDVALADPPLKGSPCGFCGAAIEGVARAVAYESGTAVGPSAAGYLCDGCAAVIQNFLEMVPETSPDGDTYWPAGLVNAEAMAEPASDSPERMRAALDAISDIFLDNPQFQFRAHSQPGDYNPGRYVEGSATAERVESVDDEGRERKRLTATVDDWTGYIAGDALGSIQIEWPTAEAPPRRVQPIVKTAGEGAESEYHAEFGALVGIDTDLEVPEPPSESQPSSEDEPGPSAGSTSPPAPTAAQHSGYTAPDRTAAEQMRRLTDERAEAIFAPVLNQQDTFEGAPDRLVLTLSVDRNVGLTGYVAIHAEGVDQDGARVAYSEAEAADTYQFHKVGQMDGRLLDVMLGGEPITTDHLTTRLYETFLFAAEKREEAHPHPPIALDGVLFPEDLSGPEGSADPTEPPEDPWEHPFPPEQQVSVGEITPESAVERLAGMDLDTPLGNLTCAAPPDQCERATVTTERHPMGDHRVVDNHQVHAGETVRVAVTVDPPLGSQYGGRDAEWRARSVWHHECAPSTEEFGDGYSLGEQSFAGFYVEGTTQEGPTETYTEAGQDYDYQPLLLTDPEVLYHRIRAERAD